MKNLVFILCFIAYLGTQAQTEKPDFKWLTVEEAGAAFAKEPKPIFINFFETGNDSCQLMVDSVYSNPTISTFLSNSFYSVNFDVNSSNPTTFFDGRSFSPGSNGLRHGLANMLIPNIKLPTVLIFGNDGKGVAYDGFMDQHRLIGLLLYYAEQANLSTDWDSFYKGYSATFPKERGAGFSIVREAVKWMTIEEALAKQAVAPKKIFLDIYANWKNTSTMMLVDTYAQDSVADILNSKFYPVRLDAVSKDTLVLKGQTFVNPGTDPKQNHVHDFVATVLVQNNLKLKFPSIVFFDEQGKPIKIHQNYYSKESIIPLLNYYANETFKEKTFEDYLKTITPTVPE